MSGGKPPRPLGVRGRHKNHRSEGNKGKSGQSGFHTPIRFSVQVRRVFSQFQIYSQWSQESSFAGRYRWISSSPGQFCNRTVRAAPDGVFSQRLFACGRQQVCDFSEMWSANLAFHVMTKQREWQQLAHLSVRTPFSRDSQDRARKPDE
jgi:hypothetical protein